MLKRKIYDKIKLEMSHRRQAVDYISLKKGGDSYEIYFSYWTVFCINIDKKVEKPPLHPISGNIT